jgi:hypothetical protein
MTSRFSASTSFRAHFVCYYGLGNKVKLVRVLCVADAYSEAFAAEKFEQDIP